jgi:hypothetical protein
MPIIIKDVDNGRGVTITGVGIFTDQEYVDALAEHLTQDPEKYKKYRYCLADYTSITKAEISYEAVWAVAKMCEKASKINPDIVVATVASRDAHYGLARMSEALFDNVEWEYKAFRDRGEAEGWIRKLVMDKYGLDDPVFE